MTSQALPKGTSLKFDFYPEDKAATSSDQAPSPSAVTIQLHSVDKLPGPEHEILRQLVLKFSVPEQHRSVIDRSVSSPSMTGYLIHPLGRVCDPSLTCCLYRFSLLSKLRVARGFGSLEGRRLVVQLRLTAFYIFLQANPAPGGPACVCGGVLGG